MEKHSVAAFHQIRKLCCCVGVERLGLDNFHFRYFTEGCYITTTSYRYVDCVTGRLAGLQVSANPVSTTVWSAGNPFSVTQTAFSLFHVELELSAFFFDEPYKLLLRYLIIHNLHSHFLVCIGDTFPLTVSDFPRKVFKYSAFCDILMDKRVIIERTSTPHPSIVCSFKADVCMCFRILKSKSVYDSFKIFCENRGKIKILKTGNLKTKVRCDKNIYVLGVDKTK